LFADSGVQHIVLCFCFVFHRLVYPMLPVSLDWLLLIAPSIFSNYLLLLNLYVKVLNVAKMFD